MRSPCKTMAIIRRRLFGLVLATMVGALCASTAHAGSASSDLQLVFRYIYNPATGPLTGDQGSFSSADALSFDSRAQGSGGASFTTFQIAHLPDPYLGENARGLEFSTNAAGDHSSYGIPNTWAGPVHLFRMNITEYMYPEFYFIYDRYSQDGGATMSHFGITAQSSILGSDPLFYSCVFWDNMERFGNNCNWTHVDPAQDVGRSSGIASLPRINGYYDFYIEGIGVTSSSYGAVPEAKTWVMMLMGFGGVGVALRRRRNLAVG